MGPQGTYHPHKGQLSEIRAWLADWPHSGASGKTHPGGLWDTSRADRGPREVWGFPWLQSYRSCASEPARPPTCFPLRVPCTSLCSRTSCQLPSKEPGRGWEGARTVRLLNVVIDLDHVLVVAESLDEVGGLLQVRVSQPHHCVGDEF